MLFQRSTFHVRWCATGACLTLWWNCSRKRSPQRHGDRTEDHRDEFSDRLLARRNFMTTMNKIPGFALLFFLIAAADPIVFRATAGAAVPLRERISLNANWRFQKGDPPGT